MPDAELARRIRLDGIDILVDLAGYTRGGRPAVLATKPAPIQASWIGYANATGIPTIDYWIVDEITDPPGSETPLGERPARLAPCFLCFEPPGWAPQVAPAPLLRRHGPTFGSFNNSRKIIAPLIALWARLLRAVPGARLLLKGRGLGEAEGDARLRAAFGAEGIDPERLELRDWLDSPEAHLRAYGDVDIALDTSPYNGTTTTCEALWMGVPVVALLGDRHASRVSASLLQAVGLPELVARDRDHYVAIAARLAADPAALAARRAGLREQVRASSLCDAPRFTRGLEAAYRAMWRDYCQGAPPAAAA
jgi:predicted O-linked N-acetylglucosamine transferase (SPINDLY family)